MLALSAVALLLAFGTPGDGTPSSALRLTPGPPPEIGAPPRDAAEPPIAVDPPLGWPRIVVDPVLPTRPSPQPPPWFAGLAVLVAASGAARRGGRRRDEWIDPLGRTTVVFVPGFGSDVTGTFDGLIAGLGLTPDRFEEFDWRLVEPRRGSHRTAVSVARIDRAADALDAYLRTIDSDRIYLVGHSKGGAAIAELVGRWDRDGSAAPGVVGATLLDPPISNGLLGDLQSAGLPFGMIPNDGGYDPQPCNPTRCRDERVDLGVASRVDVMVIRNPDAVVTNFAEIPEGLRVYDLEDDGGSPAFRGERSLGEMLARVQEAHTGVIDHQASVACIRAELVRLGSCRWTAGPAWNTNRPGNRVRGVDIER